MTIYKTNKICTDFQTSKKLKKLGFAVNTIFVYFKKELKVYTKSCHLTQEEINKLIAAYTLEQILKMLPKIIKQKECTLSLRFKLHEAEGESYIEYSNPYFNKYKYRTDIIADENLATTAARLLIKLIEEKK
jgi:hypothetical protein|tara:strand:+ start:290 stop:685 length:396 start_codon:yes stop_codon:yes gene_type:complete